MRPIYLDYNATTPISPEVADEMVPYLYEEFGNPSSSHPYGRAARHAVARARSRLATLLGCQPADVIFTSGGTESNNYAIKGAALARRGEANHVVTATTEHPAVIEVCRWLESQGFALSVLPVDEYGMVDPADLERAITRDTALVSVMMANNEVGTIQPIAEMARIAHHYGALVHTDAAQAVGKIPVNVDALDVDLLSVAGHKLYGPKGVGALYIRAGVELEPLIHGAGQEGGRRPGTESVLHIVGLGKAAEIAGRDLERDAGGRLGKAAEIAGRDLERNMAHMLSMRQRLHDGLVRALGPRAVKLNGHPQRCLPNTLSLSFRDVEANVLLAQIGDQVAASAGAACHSGEVDVSAVLRAMAIPVGWAMGTVRFSVGRETTGEEIDRAIDVVAGAVRRFQAGRAGSKK